MKIFLVSGVVIALAISGLLIWPSAEESDHIDPANPDLVAQGRTIYAAHCASCHGAKLEGQRPNWREKFPDGRWPAPPHDETGHTWHHPDGVLFEITKYGFLREMGRPPGSSMPPFNETLSDREIWTVLSFIKGTWPPEIQKRHNAINDRSRQR